ncbi:MAG: D-aminoacyl-tRNA deacylase [Bacteroidota bacterium]
MRVLLQRVKQASVQVEEREIGAIGPGILVLLGITHEDGEEDIAWLVKKITQLRIFKDEAGKMNQSVQDIGGGILVVSQFTLFGNAKKGNRPSYVRSARPEVAIPLYERFLTVLREAFQGPVATGEFGAMMEVSLINDGPVSLMIDSKERGF